MAMMGTTHSTCTIAVILVYCIVCSLSATNTSNCSTWHYFNHATQQCECVSGCYCTCDNHYLGGDGTCMTLSGQEGLYYNGRCPFGHLTNKTDRKYAELPSDPDMLEDAMCGPYNRKGLLCGECFEGYGPAVYSFDLKCAKSKYSVGFAATLYLFLELFPTALVFIGFVVFRFNITSGPLLGYLAFCQLYLVWLGQNLYVYDYIISHVSFSLRVLFQVSMTLCQFWNLKYFQSIIPPFCIGDTLTGIDIEMLRLLPATYPVVLVIITCILMELHARNCRIIHILWKPFSIILNKTNTTAVTGDAVIQAFASFILLSNVKIVMTLGSMQSGIAIRRQDYSILKQALFIDPNVEWFGRKNIRCIVIAAMPAVFLTLIPSVLLILYPTRLYSRYLSRCLSARIRLAITTFAEALHKCFKDGLNGTRDYRMLAGLLFTVPVLCGITRELIVACGYTLYISDMVTSVLFLFLFAYVQPCKQPIANFSLSLSAFLSFIVYFGYYLWIKSPLTSTHSLQVTIIFVPIVFHAFMFLWIVCALTRHTANRCQRRINCSVKVALKDVASHARHCLYSKYDILRSVA